jgi:hypothetical protein
MTRYQILGKQKAMRTQITDLSEIAVELSEREMRIVSGGLRTNGMACSPLFAPVGGSFLPRTSYITGGDHDSD